MSRTRVVIIACLAFFCLPAANAQAGIWPFGSGGLEYRIDIQGIDSELYHWFKELKLNRPEKQNPPKTLDDLEQEAVTLSEKLRKAMAAKGYFDARIEEKVERDATPPVLRMTIQTGERYRITSVQMDWRDEAISGIEPPTALEGKWADAAEINLSALDLQNRIGKDACLLSLSVTPVLQLKPANHTAVLLYRVRHGPHAVFGEIQVQGNEAVDAQVIKRAASWKQGQCYDARQIEATRSKLISLQLFSSVKIMPPETVDAHGAADIRIEVKERVPRTVQAGASYATDQGFGIKLGWEHRNMDGFAQKLAANAVLAEQEQSLSLTSTTPYFWRDDQTLTLSSKISHEDTNAYKAHSFNLGADIERKINPHVSASLGADYLLTRSEDALRGAGNYGLAYLPATITYDTRDNLQDAQKGLYGFAGLTPYLDTFDPSLHFIKTQLTGQAYLSANWLYTPTLALRASAGSIAGGTAAQLPPDQRFYAGGGGSVRGYGYQKLSPYGNGVPLGGTSLLEMSSELRLRFTQTIGGVAFLDAGNAYNASFPKLGSKLYYGAGLGGRYFSPVGPLRLDMAFPINGGNIGETGYALYVSIGQAF